MDASGLAEVTGLTRKILISRVGGRAPASPDVLPPFEHLGNQAAREGAGVGPDDAPPQPDVADVTGLAGLVHPRPRRPTNRVRGGPRPRPVGIATGPRVRP